MDSIQPADNSYTSACKMGEAIAACFAESTIQPHVTAQIQEILKDTTAPDAKSWCHIWAGIIFTSHLICAATNQPQTDANLDKIKQALMDAVWIYINEEA